MRAPRTAFATTPRTRFGELLPHFASIVFEGEMPHDPSQPLADADEVLHMPSSFQTSGGQRFGNN
eukprot:313603-Alexandrium_andersonii.AAC.1